MTGPLPVGFRVELDPSADRLDERTLCGGSPPRVLRLTREGCEALAELSRGPIASAAAGRLARRLTDAGLAHPRPPRSATPAPVTVVIPVRDRAEMLDRCLAALGCTHPVVVVDDGSQDPARVAEVAGRYGARVVRHEIDLGPAAARNSGLAEVASDCVAFLDSDCVPAPGWIEELLPHLADPEVAMVAPRIAPLASAGARGRYSRAHSCLDMGPREGLVAAGTRLAYVPSAALVARRSALLDAAGVPAFDPSLRQGEDVDLGWRLAERGYRVRYEPAVTVGHVEPDSWRALMARRYRNGTSAGPLAARHRGALPPLVLAPGPALTVAGALAGSPLAAGAGLAITAASRRRTLRRLGLTAWAAPRPGRLCGQAWVRTAAFASQAGAPLAVGCLAIGAAVPGRRRWLRRIAAVCLLATPGVVEWVRRRPDLDPVRFAAAHLADDLAYGAGVWRGCRDAGTAEPLRPVLVRSKGR